MAASNIARRVAQVTVVVALPACAPQPPRPALPPPPGLGEPLSPGPYAFFIEHPQDWDTTIMRAGYVARALPHMRWRLCDVPSPASHRTDTDRASSLADLSRRLVAVGIAPRIESDPEKCQTEPREVDMFYLAALSDD